MILLPSFQKYSKVSREGTGDDKFSFSVNGTLKARYYLIEHTDVNGVNLGTTAKTLSPGVTIVGGGGENYSGTTGVTVVGGGGIGATVSPVIVASITQINVDQQGSGYTAVPTVTIAPPTSGTTATATAVIKGPVTGMYVSDGGEYTTLPTGVTFTPIGPNGSGASGVVKGGIKNITLGIAGAKYSSAPNVTFTGGGGAGASASTVLSAEVSSITVTDGGEGYVAVPTAGSITVDNSGTNNNTSATVSGVTATVTGAKDITPGSGYDGSSTVTIDGGTYTTQATATLNIASTGQVSKINITGGGGGYMNSNSNNGSFAVTITGGGSPTVNATAIATVVGGIVTRIDVTNPGAGYTSAPSIDLEPNGDRSGGSPGGATAVYTPSGGITGITITNPGSGYTSAPTGLTFGGSGVGANFTPTLSVESITLSSGGSEYETAPNIIIPGSPTATDIPTRSASAGANLSGSVKSITLNSPGTGYTSNPVLTIQSPGAAANATVSSGVITAITVTNGGGNYTSPPAVSFSSGSATATAVVEDGIVTQIVITNGGSGYATAPDVIIGAPTGGVTATATFTMQVTEVTLSSGGQNYDVPPTINLTGGAVTSAATVEATMSVQSISLTNVGSGYDNTSLPNISIQLPDPAVGIGVANGAVQATASAETVGEITSIGMVTNGSGYTGTPFVIITDPTGNGRGAAATALLSNTTVASVTVIDGGHYTQKPTVTYSGGLAGGGTAATTNAGDITMTAPGFDEISKAKIVDKGADCTNGTYDVTVPGGTTSAVLLVTVVDKVIASVKPKVFGAGYGADVDVSNAIDLVCNCATDPVVTALKGSRISTIGLNSGGNLYNGTPTVVITPQAGDTEGGDGAAIAYLNPATVSSIALTPKNVYPAATFSDGIFTNGYNRDNVGGATNGTFITFPENYTTYRDDANTYSTTETLPGSVTYDYSISSGTPAVDTIYNVIFPQNPTRLSNPFNTNNVRRTGAGTNVENQVVFKDALGTFSGEDYDDEVTGNDMVIWVEPNIVRWDGGPNNSGTAWSNPNNWRPNGVPTPDKNVIIDFTYAALQSNNVAGPSTVIAPSPVLRVDFDLDPAAYPITCRSLTIETLIPGLNPTNARSPIELYIDEPMTILESFSASTNTTIEVLGVTDTINVGGSWSNEGRFKNGNGTVRFNQPLTRTINATSGVTETYSLAVANTSTARVGEDDEDANAFHNLILSDGTTELNSYIRVTGDLLIQNSGTRFNPSNSDFTIELWGNWQNEGTFDPKSGKVIFARFGNQTVGKGFRTAATATANVAAGSVTGFTLTGNGEKYAVAPKVVLEGGGGYGATATATIDADGKVNSLVLGTPGTNYASAPTVVFVPVDKENFHNVDVFKALREEKIITFPI